ncbi:MAG: VOC family protein [Actinomycetota bacterium]|nr:VOC family protein [Actinomycetota bacterium]
MTGVAALAYIGLSVRDPDRWQEFGAEVLGMQPVPPSGDKGVRYLRMDKRAWRIMVEKGNPGLSVIGLEVADDSTLAALCVKLEAAGHSVKIMPELAKERSVHQLARVEDPEGNVVELVTSPRSTYLPFVSRFGIRFVTGNMGLGHLVLGCEDFDASQRFYLDELGFKISDRIGGTTFTRTNARHHTVGLGPVGGWRRKGLGHFMVQVEDIDMVGAALDRVATGGGTLQKTLGRHTNDQMISFYAFGPEGIRLEFGCGAQTVDPEWWVGAYDRPSVWGHHVLVPSSDQPAAEPGLSTLIQSEPS